MDTLRGMRTFVRAVELGSLSAVARELQTTQPTVSKTVAALEQELGVRLLQRSTTHLAPTEQGRRFYERARRVLEEYGEAVADARGLTETPAGLLRVSAPVSIGVLRLNRLVQEFLASYPQIEIELILNDRYVDLVEEGMDAALRLGANLPPNAVARRIALSPRGLVASQAYLRAHPPIDTPQDVLSHNYLRFAWASESVELQGPNGEVQRLQANGRYRINNSLGIRESFLIGAGVGLAPAWLVQDLIDSDELSWVLPQWRASAHEVYLLYPARRYLPLRTRVFLEFLRERLLELPGFFDVENA
ncbi:LysR family transcriptional regulator [Lysobacter capsici]|uniref:LysR family transcriptional regulator n=1 Tax=Lysobacter capsici TaxID=435897 RepID=UPI00287BAA38|nr:LysR family transcriptional regulator [Lysobacter capsici]WND79128.1 LysR family transcriptional regulator [Lysobacter capsici]WND84323.1 LysR family transcriptional regulator [Lysobacter capsici]